MTAADRGTDSAAPEHDARTPAEPPADGAARFPALLATAMVVTLFGLSARLGPLGFVLALMVGRSFRKAHQAEAALRGWLQHVIDQMPDGVIILDARGRVATINRRARQFVHPVAWGTDPLGNPYVFDVRWPSGRKVEWSELPLARAITTGESAVGVELLLRRPDGAEVPILASASPVEDGRAGAVALFQDISALKRLEQLREEWTSVVAHDLKQPLNVLSLGLEQLARSGPPAQHGRLIERMRGAASALSRMASDLVESSRIESRRLSLNRVRVPIASWVEDTVQRTRGLIGGREVVVDSRAEARFVHADPVRLEQVLTNLLTNAAKYGEPGTEILVGVRDRGSEQVVVSVTNRGPGLSGEEAKRLFDRFYRTEGGRSRTEGSGLGLYIVKGLVEAHGGHVEVDSRPGETTTFRFTLPVWKERTGAQGSPLSARVGSSSGTGGAP